MALSDIRKFLFYPQYIWQPTDFADFQTWLLAHFNGLFEGLTGGGVLSGCRVSTVGGMTLQVDAGLAVSPSGVLVQVTSAVQATFASDPTLPRRSLLVLRPKLTNTNNIPQPTNPLVQVPLHQQYGYDLVVIPGVPAASPTYPAKQVDDIAVMGVKIPAAATSLSVTDFETGQRDVPHTVRKKIRELTTSETPSYTVASGDVGENIIEVSASSASGAVNLPPASTMLGRELTVVKVDSSGNVVHVIPNGGEQISGQTFVELDTQWQTVTIYANKNSWRMR
jgi:hypothetical protein